MSFPCLVIAAAACLLLPLPARANTKSHARIRALLTGSPRFKYDKEEIMPVLYHEPGSSSVLVGAEDVLYMFDFNSTMETKHRVNFTATDLRNCRKEPWMNCKNYLTVLHKFKGQLLICGSNAYNATCWIGVNKTETMDGSGISPVVPDQNKLLLFSGDDIYSTMSKFWKNGKIPRFRRIKGKEPHLYTKDNLLKNPYYVKIKLMEQEESYKDKIYIFFREDNPEKNVETDVTVSRVAHLCKEDGGGEGGQDSSTWSTFLKAKLECSNPEKGQFYSRLQDLSFIVHEKETIVYGVFSNAWHESAICVYTMSDIDRLFRTSAFKGTSNVVASGIRPGECLPGGRKTPAATSKMASDHPEMEQAITPVGRRRLFHSREKYSRIVVDQITAEDSTPYNVLFLTTESGAIHKLVEFNGSVVNILEMRPFKTNITIHSMELDSDKKRLYVTTSHEVVEVPLEWCDVYGKTCNSCTMAMDPYCGWADGRCVAIRERSKESAVQNIERCPAALHKTTLLPKGKETTNEDANVFKVKPSSKYFLPCPVSSYHATYSLVQNETVTHSCVLDQDSSQCIYHINKMAMQDSGHYKCVVKENDMVEVMAQYRLELDHGSTVVDSLWLVTTQLAVYLLLLH
ncbi:semaphorin-7A [Ambystoma mexicanum]|uniref:semaphorin-7A n=1 Tax=Ambystoma mexicanum TaxID=8296 RepID=UPI0037E8EC3C